MAGLSDILRKIVNLQILKTTFEIALIQYVHAYEEF